MGSGHGLGPSEGGGGRGGEGRRGEGTQNGRRKGRAGVRIREGQEDVGKC